MKVPSSLVAVSLLSLVDNVQSAVTIPLKAINPEMASKIKQSTKPTSKGTVTVPVKDWIKHGADLQVHCDSFFALFLFHGMLTARSGTPKSKWELLPRNCKSCESRAQDTG